MLYEWPGNVRELENAIERAIVVGKERKLRMEDLPFFCVDPTTRPASKTLKDVEKEHIIRILDANNWNIALSAKILGIDRSTLYSKIKRYQLSKPD
jgi:transcriptional regulator of acetoin/glycerol metabolism